MAYIPKKHEKYDLIPEYRDSGEVFDYPSTLIDAAERLIGKDRGLFPYGYDSYEEYYAVIDGLIAEYASSPEIEAVLVSLKTAICSMNQKENWSVLRYRGPSLDGVATDLTPGRCYYWPTSAENPVYNGVIMDGAFTSYQYPTAQEYWEILEDPTGMAYRTVYEGAKGALSVEKYSDLMKQVEILLENEPKT